MGPLPFLALRSGAARNAETGGGNQGLRQAPRPRGKAKRNPKTPATLAKG